MIGLIKYRTYMYFSYIVIIYRGNIARSKCMPNSVSAEKLCRCYHLTDYELGNASGWRHFHIANDRHGDEQGRDLLLLWARVICDDADACFRITALKRASDFILVAQYVVST